MQKYFLLSLSFLLFTQIVRAELPHSSRGEAAIRKHDHELDKIAKRYNLSTEKLKGLLRRDASMALDDSGNIYVSEEALLPDYLGDLSDVLNPLPSQIPDSEAFKLHSRTGSKKTLLLDFTGHEVVNTSWNILGEINAGPIDMDGDPTTFSAAERAKIKEVWLRVAEDFAPFDVDVTTEDVANEDQLTFNSSTDQVYGLRVLLTNSHSWYGSGAGGVAFINSIRNTSSAPCFVFTTLLNYNTKNMAEAASHEAGHVLGLYHSAKYDEAGNYVSDYNWGMGSSIYGWAPIMGAGYNQKNTLWHNGPTPYGATSSQDDVAIIKNNFSGLSDDAPDAISATSFRRVKFISEPTQQTLKHQGLFEIRGNVDVLRIYAGAGPLTVNVSEGAHGGPNVDFRVRLLAPTGEVLTDQNPFGSQNISVSLADVPEGIYQLEISPSSADGYYTNYGVLGRYYVSGGTGIYSQTIPADTYTVSTPTTPNVLPVVNAGADLIVTTPATSAQLVGSATDNDGYIASVAWAEISGPNNAIFSATTILAPKVSGLIVGTYTFRLTVKDNQGAVKTDDVKVVVRKCKGKNCG